MAFCKGFLYLLALVCAVLLFVGNGDETIRSHSLLWNAGHLPAFGLWTFLMIRLRCWPNRWTWTRQLILGLAIAAAASLAVESLQLLVGRTFSLADIRRNLLGCMVVFFFAMPEQDDSPVPRRVPGPAMRTGLVVLVLLELWPLGKVLLDESAAADQFPILSNLEAPFEIERWMGNAGLALNRRIKKEGRAALAITFGTQHYSGAVLEYFPADWSAYEKIVFDAFNPRNEPMALVCRIHDAAHERNGNAYNDRFNRRLTILPGWQRILLSLDDVRHAPVSRQMDMHRIKAFMLFAIDLDRPRTLIIDQVRLLP